MCYCFSMTSSSVDRVGTGIPAGLLDRQVSDITHAHERLKAYIYTNVHTYASSLSLENLFSVRDRILLSKDDEKGPTLHKIKLSFEMIFILTNPFCCVDSPDCAGWEQVRRR